MAAGRILAAFVKELRQLGRDRFLLFLVGWFFTAEIVLCTVSLTFELEEEPVALVDFDRSTASRALAERLDRSSTFHIAARPASVPAAADLIDAGNVRLALVIAPGYATALSNGRGPQVQLVVDGANALVAQTLLAQARALLMDAGIRSFRGMGAVLPGVPLAAAAGEAPIQPRAPTGPPVLNQLRIWYNPALHSSWFMVISVLATAAYVIGVILPAAAIVREKERGTIEQILVSPLRPAELLLAKSLPTLLVGVLALLPGLLIAQLFGVPFVGSQLAFAIATLTLYLAAIATGILIALVSRTLQQTLLIAFFVLFPLLFLSGTFTPIESMPAAVELLSRFSPLRYYVDALLAILLKGGDLGTIRVPLLSLLALSLLLWATLAAVLGVRRGVV